MTVARTFCVYEHWRPDKDVCFYVGKGSVQRAQFVHRKHNNRHTLIVAKLKRLDLTVRVVTVASGLSEAAAFALEKERIAMWRNAGDNLVNATDGGDGTSGRKLSAEEIAKLKTRVYSEEHKQRISEAKTGVPVPQERRARISLALTGRKASRETIEKRVAHLRGKPRSPEVCAKISAAKKGVKLGPMTDVCRERIRAAALADWAKRKALKREEVVTCQS